MVVQLQAEPQNQAIRNCSNFSNFEIRDLETNATLSRPERRCKSRLRMPYIFRKVVPTYIYRLGMTTGALLHALYHRQPSRRKYKVNV